MAAIAVVCVDDIIVDGRTIPSFRIALAMEEEAE
jgi:pyrimidine operon attenuation protein/uracil phosphoribosyltransferase